MKEYRKIFLYIAFSFFASTQLFSQRGGSEGYYRIASSTGEKPKGGDTRVEFNCGQPITSSCNYFLNKEFATINNVNNTTPITAAFYWNMVNDWETTRGTPDLNIWNNLSSPFSAVPASAPNNNVANLAVVQAGSSLYDEGIFTKIKTLTPQKKYALSFFRCVTPVYTDPFKQVTIKVYLAHCSGYPSTTSYQPVYCEAVRSIQDWKQAFVTFVADEDYDLVLFSVETELEPYLSVEKGAVFNLSTPELIDAETISQSLNAANCETTLTAPCGVTNMDYTWKSPSGNIIGNTQQVVVNGNVNPGNYFVQMDVPGSIGSNCQPNGPQPIGATINLPISCDCGELQVTTATAEYYNASTGNSTLYTQTLNTCSTNDLCYNNNEILWLTLSSNQASGNHWEFFFSNPAQYNSGFNYYTGSAYDQSIYGFFVITPNETGTLEIRLTNSVTGTVKSIFVRIQYKASAGWWCNSLDPAYEYRMIGSSTENPYNTYSWSFPSGMVVNDLHIRLPNFSYTTTYTGTYPANAVLTVTNAYCPSYTSTVPIQPGNPYCYARTANGGTMINPLSVAEELEKKMGVKIYPNPTSASFEIQTAKKLNEVTVSSVEGKLIKRFGNIGSKKSFNIGELSKGSYLVTICYADFSKETKIIIKQ